MNTSDVDLGDAKLALLRQQAEALLDATDARTPLSELEHIRVEWLGKKGHLAQLYRHLRELPEEQRPALGQHIHRFRSWFEKRLDTASEAARPGALAATVERTRLDVTLPLANTERRGALHPVSLLRQRALDIFQRLGFVCDDGPDIESDFYNFSALNIPRDHPARDSGDTFFLAGMPYLMRTQTSTVQIHAMRHRSPPLRLVAPGRCFRVDSDATHSPMFHQLECLHVDRDLSMGHLKGLIFTFLSQLFGDRVRVRLRSSYFPFVEPGAEADCSCMLCDGRGCRVCGHSGWIEIGGCGMVHPNVFEAMGIDSEHYSGYAFGFGLDRMAMIAYRLPDLRDLFSGDVRLLSQFPISAVAEPAGLSCLRQEG